MKHDGSGKEMPPMATQRFELPYPPSGNHRLKVGVVKGRPAFFKTSQYRLFESLVGVALNQQKITPYRADLRLSCTIKLYPPDRRLRDIDGAVKCVWDCLEKYKVIENDFVFWHLDITRCEVYKPNGKVWVMIEPLDKKNPGQ